MAWCVGLIKRGGVILWPTYFERRLSRKKGRRVSLKLAVDKVTTELIAKACKSLGLEYEIVEASYPKIWWRKTGYVIVKGGSIKKSELIKRVAENLKRK